MDVLLKVYFPKPAEGGKPAKPGGLLSCHLDSLKVGDEVKVKGPTGSLIYEASGWISYQARFFHVRFINLVCGGTGITPAWQLLVDILRRKDDETKVTLLYSSVSPSDVLLRAELDELAEKHQSRFHLFYSVDRNGDRTEGGTVEKPEENGGEETEEQAKSSWPFNFSHLNEKLVREHLFPPTQDCLCFVCGPPPMQELAVYPALDAYGFDKRKQVLDF